MRFIPTLLVIALGSPLLAGEPPSSAARKPTTTIPNPGTGITDAVAENYRDAVAAVLKAPTMSVKGEDDEFKASPKVYDWLLEHPDRVSLAWQRLKVPCVEITDLGKGQFRWADENGSELTWQTVGKLENGAIWYATGKVKTGLLVPTVPVKAVAILKAPREALDKDGGSTIKPTVQLYMLTDSKVAAAAMRVVGPAAPKMAEQGAEQLLFFFSGVARYIHKKPDQLETLLAPKK